MTARTATGQNDCAVSYRMKGMHLYWVQVLCARVKGCSVGVGKLAEGVADVRLQCDTQERLSLQVQQQSAPTLTDKLIV